MTKIPIESEKHPGGRPSEWKDEYVALAFDYLTNFDTKYNDAFPMISGLADEIGVEPDTLNNWAKDHPEFFGALRRIRTKQKRVVQNKTAFGSMNTTMGIRVLAANHGMAEKQESKTELNGNVSFSLSELLKQANG